MSLECPPPLEASCRSPKFVGAQNLSARVTRGFFIYVKTRRRGATDEAPTGRKRKHTHANAKAHTILYTSPLGPHRSRSRSEGRGGYRGHEPLLVLVKNSLLPLPPPLAVGVVGFFEWDSLGCCTAVRGGVESRCCCALRRAEPLPRGVDCR